MTNINKYAPEPSEEQVKLIEDLGGPWAVARALKNEFGFEGFTGNAVSNWKRRGIPWRFRGPLVVLANKKGVDLPPDFFGVERQK